MCTTRPRYALPGAAATRPACALHSTLRVGDTRGLPGGTRLARRVHAGGRRGHRRCHVGLPPGPAGGGREVSGGAHAEADAE
jgi:hypothetical protein